MFVGSPDSRPPARNRLEIHDPRSSTDTSDTPSCTNPAGLANVAVASSARPTNEPARARLLAPGLRKSNWRGIWRLVCAKAAVGVATITLVNASRARVERDGVRPAHQRLFMECPRASAARAAKCTGDRL